MNVDFIWNWLDEEEGNVEKLRQHGLTVDDVEFVIEGASRSQVEESRSSNQPILFGFMEDGREIAVVFEWVDRQTINVITAYEPEEGN